MGDGIKKTAVQTWLSGAGDLLSSVQSPLQNWDSWIGSKPNLDAYSANDSWITGYKNEFDIGAKTVFDPCPDGWRVPVRVNQTNTDATNHWGSEAFSIYTTWSSTSGNIWDSSCGTTWPTKGGYYPVAGYRDSNDLVHVGKYGSNWSASPSGGNGYILFLASKHVTPSSYKSRSLGYSVRCVAE